MSVGLSPRKWTRAMTVALVRLRRQGRSFREIVHCLGVAHSAAIARGVFARLAIEPERANLPADVGVFDDEPEPLGSRHEILEDGVCHWIRGDVTHGDWRMCGRPSAAGSPWCPHHLARVWVSRADRGMTRGRGDEAEMESRGSG